MKKRRLKTALRDLMDRMFRRVVFHSLYYLSERAGRSIVLDRSFLSVMQQSLDYLLKRAKEGTAEEIEEVLRGLLRTNVYMAEMVARIAIDECPTKVDPSGQVFSCLTDASMDLLQTAARVFTNLQKLRKKDDLGQRRLAEMLTVLVKLVEERQIESLVMRMSQMVSRERASELGRRIFAEKLEPEEWFLIPEFKRREKPVLNTWSYQNEVMDWSLKPGDLVLDVGSGGWPFSKATHLSDMFLEKTTHRFESLKRDGRPFLAMDICHMPFRDKAWDFLFCSHVLEHLDRPGDALRELVRVGRRGYIEVPTRLSDVMLNFTRLKSHHRWHGLVLGKTLLLIEWKEEERRDLGQNHFYKCLHSQYHNEFQKLFEENWNMFYAILNWEKGLEFLIIDRNGKIVDYSVRDEVFS